MYVQVLNLGSTKETILVCVKVLCVLGGGYILIKSL